MAMNDSKRVVAAALAVLMAMASMPIGIANAEMVTTDTVIQQYNSTEDRTLVMDFMLREDVQQQLTLLGVDPEEAARRVASLSDEEIQGIAGRLEEMPAGEGSVGIIVGAVVIIFIILLVTDLLGLTDVFPFVKKKSE
ncbi:MAG: PA2779 family protein [Kiloniellales bacterium]